jgi:AraC-like DNA-binding protein
VADQHRRQRDRLILQLRAEDPRRWTYLALARAVGCSPELIAHVVRTSAL